MLTLSASAARAVEYVDLELVIATDVSYSIDEGEAALQREGIAAAFRSKDIIQAIQSGFLRKIAVAYIDYSSFAFNRVIIDWRIISDRESAERFASDLLGSPRTFGRRTSISDGVALARKLIETNNIEGTRRAIDVSGDGPNNSGALIDQVRDETVARGITINGLPILNPGDQFMSRFYLPDLDLYYRGCVIGGPGAFYEVARDFKDFARAIRRKLILEIAAAPPVRSLLVPAADRRNLRPGGAGYVYEKGCDIGERMRGYIWGDDDGT